MAESAPPDARRLPEGYLRRDFDACSVLLSEEHGDGAIVAIMRRRPSPFPAPENRNTESRSRGPTRREGSRRLFAAPASSRWPPSAPSNARTMHWNNCPSVPQPGNLLGGPWITGRFRSEERSQGHRQKAWSGRACPPRKPQFPVSTSPDGNANRSRHRSSWFGIGLAASRAGRGGLHGCALGRNQSGIRAPWSNRRPTSRSSGCDASLNHCRPRAHPWHGFRVEVAKAGCETIGIRPMRDEGGSSGSSSNGLAPGRRTSKSPRRAPDSGPGATTF